MQLPRLFLVHVQTTTAIGRRWSGVRTWTVPTSQFSASAASFFQSDKLIVERFLVMFRNTLKRTNPQVAV